MFTAAEQNILFHAPDHLSCKGKETRPTVVACVCLLVVVETLWPYERLKEPSTERTIGRPSSITAARVCGGVRYHRALSIGSHQNRETGVQDSTKKSPPPYNLDSVSSVRAAVTDFLNVFRQRIPQETIIMHVTATDDAWLQKAFCQAKSYHADRKCACVCRSGSIVADGDWKEADRVD